MGSFFCDLLSSNHDVAVYDANPQRLLFSFMCRRFESLDEVDAFAPELMINCVTLKYTLDSFREVLPHLPADCVISDIASVKTELPETIEAPVKKGTVLGTATLSYAGEELTTVDLVAAETVERSELLYTMDQAKAVLTSQWFLITAAVIGTLFLIYLFLLILYRRKKKKLRRVKGMRRM